MTDDSLSNMSKLREEMIEKNLGEEMQCIQTDVTVREKTKD